MNDIPLPLDTGVLITLAAATSSWDVLNVLDRPIVVTETVWNEVRQGPKASPGVNTPLASCMSLWKNDHEISPWLLGVLDKGEASVIALALTQNWPEVGIDEAVGRSVARTSRLRVTGSLGLLIQAKRKGYAITIRDAIATIRHAGIWIGIDVEQAALRVAGETP